MAATIPCTFQPRTLTRMRRLRSTVLGSFAKAASTVALIYLVGLVVLLFAPETKGKPLPE